MSTPVGHRGRRADILIELKRAGGLTAKDLAALLDVSLNAVRHHLKELEAGGVVEYRRERRGVGAPSHTYGLTPAGEALFPRRSEELVGQILDFAASTQGVRGAIVAALEDRYLQMADRLESELSGANASTRLEAVARVLEDEGYMAEWSVADGRIRLTEHHCAVRTVAERFPELCEAEARFLEQVLGAGVERRLHILDGCRACEYHIRFDTAGPDGDAGGPAAGSEQAAQP
jgi:predicted ArsR family transcriptional regulator